MKFNYRLGNDYLSDNRIILETLELEVILTHYLSYDDIVRQELTSTAMFNINKDVFEKFNINVNIGQDYKPKKVTKCSGYRNSFGVAGIENGKYSNFDPGYRFINQKKTHRAFGDATFSYDDYLF